MHLMVMVTDNANFDIVPHNAVAGYNEDYNRSCKTDVEFTDCASQVYGFVCTDCAGV